MLAVLLWLGGALACVVLTSSLYVFQVRPALHHRRHQRTLANIARLEALNGYGPITDEEVDQLGREIETAYRVSIGRAPPEPTERIYGDCAECGRHVVINAGRCKTDALYGQSMCAKELYQRERR